MYRLSMCQPRGWTRWRFRQDIWLILPVCVCSCVCVCVPHYHLCETWTSSTKPKAAQKFGTVHAVLWGLRSRRTKALQNRDTPNGKKHPTKCATSVSVVSSHKSKNDLSFAQYLPNWCVCFNLSLRLCLVVAPEPLQTQTQTQFGHRHVVLLGRFWRVVRPGVHEGVASRGWGVGHDQRLFLHQERPSRLHPQKQALRGVSTCALRGLHVFCIRKAIFTLAVSASNKADWRQNFSKLCTTFQTSHRLPTSCGVWWLASTMETARRHQFACSFQCWSDARLKRHVKSTKTQDPTVGRLKW